MFVALYPPPEVVAKLSVDLERVKREDAGSEAVRWTLPEQWHLTLAFLPKVDEDRLTRLGQGLGEVANSCGTPPRLAVAGVGRFGASTLWWALAPDPARDRWLAQLARHVRRVCRSSGVATDDSRWRPHITIGRVRRDAPAGTARHWVDALAGCRSEEWTPAAVALVTSVTGPVLTHTTTGTWPLAANP